MSQENVEVVRQIYDAWNDDDISRLPDLFDERTRLRLNVMMGPYLGHQGVRQFVVDLRADWLQLSMSVQEAIDGGDRIIAIVREDGIGRSSRVPISSIETHVWTVRDGRAFRADAYPNRAKALESVGLSE
jgi:ketosteroid isomerase-like protein